MTGELRGRDRQLAAAVDAFDRRQLGGVVLLGPGGVGKTRLAARLQDALVERGASAVRVSATRAAADVPLGAFAGLLPALSAGPLDLVGAVRRELQERAGAGDLVLFVDDAHLLDAASASVLLQVAQEANVFTVVTVRQGEAVSDDVTALWRNGLVLRLDVGPLPDDVMAAIASDLVGGPLHELAQSRLLALATGNPLALTELVLGAEQTGALALRNGRWSLVADFARSPRLAELIADRLGNLSADELRTLELVVLAEPIGLMVLADLVPPDAIDALERRRLIEVRADVLRTDVWLSHPLHGEVLRAQMPTQRRRAAVRTLVERCKATGARRRGDVLRLATWSLELGDFSDPDLLIEASRQCYVAIDFERALALATAAWQAEPSVAAGHLLGWLRCTLVDHAGAEAVLAKAESLVADDRERVLVAMARSENLFRCDDAEGAIACVQAAEAACEDADWRAELLGHRAALVMLRGDLARADELVADLVQPPKPNANVRPFVQASIPAATVAAFDARPLDAIRLAQAGFVAHIGVWQDGVFQSDPGTHLYSSVVGLTMAGQLDEAETLLGNLVMEVLTAGWGTALAALTLQRGLIAQERGLLRTAVGWFERATVLFEEHGPQRRRRFPLGSMVGAFGMLGDVDGGRHAAALLDAEAGSALGFTRPSSLVARSWLATAEGTPHRAQDLLEEAFELGLSKGERAASVDALHAMARQGRVALIGDRVGVLRDHVQGDLFHARLDHVEALAAREPARLLAVAETFQVIGSLLCAAEAQAEAGRRFEARGESRQATAAAASAARLLARCEGAATPAVSAGAGVVPLTPRERDVARLAASGLASKEIAARLDVSRRTVDNQLQSVYAKLGVRSRGELEAALGA